MSVTRIDTVKIEASNLSLAQGRELATLVASALAPIAAEAHPGYIASLTLELPERPNAPLGRLSYRIARAVMSALAREG